MTIVVRIDMGPDGGRGYFVPIMKFYDLENNFGVGEVRTINNGKTVACLKILREGKRLVPSPDRGVGWAWLKIFKDGTSRIEGPNPELFG